MTTRATTRRDPHGGTQPADHPAGLNPADHPAGLNPAGHPAGLNQPNIGPDSTRAPFRPGLNQPPFRPGLNLPDGRPMDTYGPGATEVAGSYAGRGNVELDRSDAHGPAGGPRRRWPDLPALAEKSWRHPLALAVALFAAGGPAHALGHTDLVFYLVICGLAASAVAVPLGLMGLRHEAGADDGDEPGPP